jgi:sugar (pentulose or hexulose) kinase
VQSSASPTYTRAPTSTGRSWRGLAYGLREGKERLEKRANTPITELRISGGGSQSDAAMQLTADIFGLPAIRPHVYETSGLGAAIDAAVGLKLHPDFAAARA